MAQRRGQRLACSSEPHLDRPIGIRGGCEERAVPAADTDADSRAGTVRQWRRQRHPPIRIPDAQISTTGDEKPPRVCGERHMIDPVVPVLNRRTHC